MGASRYSSDNSLMRMAIGTYTSSGAEGVYLGTINIDNGKIVITDSAKQVNPSFVCITNDNKTLYAVTETEDNNAGVTAYRINGNKIDKLNTISKLGGSPCNIGTNGMEIATAEYGGGSLSRIAINKDGSLGSIIQHTKYSGHSVDLRSQVAPHIHSAQYRNGLLYITDLGCDKMYIQRGNATIDTIKFAPNFGPRHFVFSNNGEYMYLIGELSGKVCVAKRKGNTYVPIQYILSDLTPGENGKGSGDIHISPCGKFIYASNRKVDDGIAIFAINDDGTINRTGYTFTGKHPRNFTITPNGKWLIVACRDSNSIEFYERNNVTGDLTPHKELTINMIKMPVCLQIF